MQYACLWAVKGEIEMIVPFVFTLATYSEAPYLWFFYKWLDTCKKHGWPMIAQEVYFRSPKYFARQGYPPAFEKKIADRFEYSLPKERDLNMIPKHQIPEKLIDKLVEEKGSYSDASAFLLTHSYSPLVEWIDMHIQKIQKHSKEPIEAFSVLQHLPSLSVAADKYQIPVIHNEMGPFRQPNYLKTNFWDLDNIFGGHTIEERYRQFCAEQQKCGAPLFTGEEILSLFLLPEQLDVLKRLRTSRFVRKIGVALGNVMDPVNSSKTRFNDNELLYRLERKYGMERLLLRRHPGDPYGAQYPRYSGCMQPAKESLFDFILQCETIASIGSNVVIEAMYYGRKGYIFTPCPSYYAASNRFDEDPVCADDTFLSFFALGYLIPYIGMTDPAYIRWRLSNPSEMEIYNRHLKFYLDKKNIPESVLSEKRGKRLELMVKAQCSKPACKEIP